MRLKIKSILAILCCICIASGFCGCNKQLVDFTYYYNYAIIKLPNGEVIEGEIDSWKDYDDGEQLQVVIKGTSYLVHAENVCLINKGDK